MALFVRKFGLGSNVNHPRGTCTWRCACGWQAGIPGAKGRLTRTYGDVGHGAAWGALAQYAGSRSADAPCTALGILQTEDHLWEDSLLLRGGCSLALA